MSEVKTFRITGEIKKGKTKVPFSVEFNAMKEEHALTRMYAEMGSRHRARRFEIKVTKIQSGEQEAAQAKE